MMTETLANDIEFRARTALSSSPIFALRELTVDADADGESLVISGQVASFYHKQLAQEVVLAVASGMQVVNSLNVE